PTHLTDPAHPADPTEPAEPVEPIDPMGTPGIHSVNEQGAPLFAGTSVPAGGTVLDAEQEQAGQERDGESAGPSAGPSAATGARDHSRTPALIGPPEGRIDVPEPARPDQYSFRLVTRRSLYDQGTLVQEASSLAPLASRAMPKELRVRPKALEQLGVHDGDEVRARSGRTDLVVCLVGDDHVPEGVAVMAHNAAPVDMGSPADLLHAGSVVIDLRLETIS
ncbi:MAG: molybdopterin dinucleotide binding domain-containing protein, partial [Acidimicrobiales bacterium]